MSTVFRPVIQTKSGLVPAKITSRDFENFAKIMSLRTAPSCIQVPKLGYNELDKFDEFRLYWAEGLKEIVAMGENDPAVLITLLEFWFRPVLFVDEHNELFYQVETQHEA